MANLPTKIAMQDTGKTPLRTFYWFDYETYGTDPKRDLPAQFGGFRTTEAFETLGSQSLLYNQISEDYLPDPGACILTGITPLTALDEGISEAEFSRHIFKELIQPGTIAVGYNSLGFDDEVTRFMFWRNLLPAYDREYGEGRGRLDIFNVVRAVFTFYPDTLQWLKKEDGTYSLKLEHLTKANGLIHEHAHDALSDAKATMLLAKMIATRQPKLWNYFLKIHDGKELKSLFEQRAPLLYVNPYAPQAKRYISAVFPLIQDPTQKNSWLCWDLEREPQELLSLTDKDIKERFYLTREQREQGVPSVPIIRINLKKQPFVTTGMGWLDKAGKGLLSTDLATLKNNARWLEQRLEEVDGIVKNLMTFADEERTKNNSQQNSEIETALYSGGFLSDRDRFELQRLRDASPEVLATSSSKIHFDREELKDLVFRFRARNFSEETLTAEEEKLWRRYKQEHLIQGKNGARTFESFLTTIEKLRETATSEQEDILDQLQEYGENLMADYQ